MLTTKMKTGAMALAIFAASLPPAEAQELNFGIIATEASANQKVAWEPFLAEMTKGTGLTIKAFYATDYAAVIESMRFNKVQVAWYGNKSGMEAVDRSQGEVFAQTIGKHGEEGYYAHLVTNIEKPFNTLEDVLKCDGTLNFGIGDPNSTSGFLVPSTYIFAARAIDPKKCFKTVRNGSHQVNSMAAANNLVDVATNNSEDLQRLEISAPEARKKIKVIWTSPLITLDPIVWRKDLDAGVKSKISAWLLGYGRTGSPDEIARAREVLGKLIWAPMKPSSNHQLLPIRAMEATKAKFKVESDDKMPADEKKAALAEIEATLAKLAEMQKKADSDPTLKTYAEFAKLDPVKDADAIKTQIGEFTASLAKLAY